MKHSPAQENVRKYQKEGFVLTERGQKRRAISQPENDVYRLINEDISPVAVIKQSALTNNLNWMQSIRRSPSVKLSPHGKTSMTPAFSASNSMALGVSQCNNPCTG